MGDKDTDMSERDRALAEKVAEVVMAKMIEALSSEHVSSHIVSVWGRNVDVVIGRALRRLLLYVFIGLIAIGSMKLGVLERLLDWLKH